MLNISLLLTLPSIGAANLVRCHNGGFVHKLLFLHFLGLQATQQLALYFVSFELANEVEYHSGGCVHMSLFPYGDSEILLMSHHLDHSVLF